MLIQVCSDINKPNGQFILPSDRMAVMTFISSLPIRKVSLLRDCSLFFVLDLEGYKGPFKYPVSYIFWNAKPIETCNCAFVFVNVSPYMLHQQIGGIGKVTEQILRNAFEIDTCKDLLEKGSFLCALFSPSSAGE